MSVVFEKTPYLTDKQFHYFHPCCSYPMSDMEIEVYSR